MCSVCPYACVFVYVSFCAFLRLYVAAYFPCVCLWLCICVSMCLDVPVFTIECMCL